jgi:hypothetical protein
MSMLEKLLGMSEIRKEMKEFDENELAKELDKERFENKNIQDIEEFFDCS